MIIIGVKEAMVEICVSITPNQLPTVKEMYPDHLFLEQQGVESIGWAYDGTSFAAP